LWTSWEGLNSILLGQVSEIESLISMPADFRFVVFNLWAKYLQVTEVAFTKHRLMPHLKKALCNRYRALNYSVRVQLFYTIFCRCRDAAWINQQRLVNRKKKRMRRKKSVTSMTEDSSEISSRRSISSLKVN
jgi:hypothetical protein